MTDAPSIPQPFEGSVHQYPSKGVVLARYGSGFYTDPDTGREATTNIAGVTYDVWVQTGLSGFTIQGATPNKRRWNADCFPAQSGDVCDLAWFGDQVSFSVDEPPVLEDCANTGP